MLVLNDDEDADGVTDFKDDCPQTPAGAKVNEHGCPIDTDGDGVPDGVDEEPATAPGAPVDARGVTITDDQFLKAWLNYADSGNVNIISSTAESLGRKPNVMVKPKRILAPKPTGTAHVRSMYLPKPSKFSSRISLS